MIEVNRKNIDYRGAAKGVDKIQAQAHNVTCCPLFMDQRLFYVLCTCMHVLLKSI